MTPSSHKEQAPFQVHSWQRDERNPVLPPGPSAFDVECCMNPFAIRRGEEYYLFYAGGDGNGKRRICLAIAPVGDLSAWKRLGPVLEVGGEGSFDASWCVLPCVHRIGNRWHLYYTGRHVALGGGLQSFTGIGLAVSNDLLHWSRLSPEPVLRGDGFAEWPDNRGIAGGGRIIELAQEDGRTLYRKFYTLATGTPSPDLLVDQRKYAVSADSYDGVEWFNKQVVLRPRPEADYENAATIALNLWKTATGWRAIYAGIGSRFGAYSICEAESCDGRHWHRGAPGENLALPPQGAGWESRMTEYPNVIEENGRLRLFYCGNGYGRTGIGTAIADKLSF
ncbi:MAG TPA: hypothetical protein VNQ90_21420 [Chthoniobacteraceae bacterium]|nr:hypothetical protein [Chthoniobacteraceae bacterium]